MLKSFFELFIRVKSQNVTKMNFIKCSPSNTEFFRTGYPAKNSWGISAQCGGNSKHGFFFEAFPVFGFIRADSKLSMEDAEEKAWMKYQAILKCKADHKNPENLDRKDYQNGCAFCKTCNGFISSSYSNLQPTTSCQVCKKPTFYTSTNDGLWVCKDCIKTLPDNKLNTHQLDQRYKRGIFSTDAETAVITHEDISTVLDHIHQNLKNEEK